MKESFDQREYGDYQTPPQFASDVCKYIKKYIGSNFDICIEPTCGTGNFVINGMKFFPNARHIAIEINPIYLDTLRKLIDNNFIRRDEYTLDGAPFDFEDEHYDASGLCIDDFVAFMEKWKAYNLKLIVYLVEPDRHDYRISPRGLIVKSRDFNKDGAFQNDFYNTILATSFAHYYESRGIRGCYWFD